MLGRLIRDFRQLHRALTRHYRRRARRPRTPEEEVDRLMAQLHRNDALVRRLIWRR